MFQNIGLHRMPVLGGFLQHRHVPDARHSHIQRPGDRGGAEGEHIHVFGHFLKMLFLGHAETLFLVNDAKPQVVEGNILLYQAVGSDNHIDLPAL